MPLYNYTAVDKNGIVFKNKVREKSKQILIIKLKNNGITPIKVRQATFDNTKTAKRNQTNIEDLMKIASNISETEKANEVKFSDKAKRAIARQRKIEVRDIIVFTNQFYLLKKANFNNIQALETLIKACENITLSHILEEMLANIEDGNYMYQTMELYPDVFPYIYISLIKVGETSGSLEESLKHAVKYMETSTALSKKIKGMLIPSIIQFVVLIIVLNIGTLYVIPLIQNVYSSMGSHAQLPWYSLAFQRFLLWYKNIWYIPLLFIGAIAAEIFLKAQTPEGRYKWDLFLYKMPLFGPLNFAIDFSRVCNAMLLNLKNGQRIQDALESAKNVTNNYVMISIIETAINNVVIGESWVDPFERSGLTNSMMTEMLKVGMQTDLSEMMDKLVEYMNYDIDIIIDRIVKVLPQILYIIIGIMLIFVTLVVLVPSIQVYMGGWIFEAAGY